MNQSELIRAKYKPSGRTKILLVGESPPANGSFFYEESAMTTYTRTAFETALERNFLSDHEFFVFMRDNGYYLEDLSLIPVDKLPHREREAELRKQSTFFAERVRLLNPEVLIIVLKKIEKIARESIQIAGINPEIYALPFPGWGFQKRYKDELASIINKYSKEK